MGREVISLLIQRIEEHLVQRPQDEFSLAFHGGEPLLWGAKNLDWALSLLRDRLPQMSIGVQTNGLVLTEEHIDLLKRRRVSISISSDGPQMYQKHRVSPLPKPIDVSHRIDSAILEVNKRIPQLMGGVLVVADLSTDPRPILDYLMGLNVTMCDFLLPMANRQLSPTDLEDLNSQATRYLHLLMDGWIAVGFDQVHLRWFLELARSRASEIGGRHNGSRLDSLGGTMAQVMTIEADGRLCDVDVNRTLGAARVPSAMLSETTLVDYGQRIAEHYGADVSEACSACAYFSMCGGGYLPHRFDGNSVHNPSAYCASMKSICQRITELVD